jgi:hypothetical protein
MQRFVHDQFYPSSSGTEAYVTRGTTFSVTSTCDSPASTFTPDDGGPAIGALWTATWGYSASESQLVWLFDGVSCAGTEMVVYTKQ